MSKFAVGFVAVVSLLAVSAFGQNRIVFDNQSGDPALVRLIGPTQTDVEVPRGARAGTDAAAGRYVIKVRYGTPGSYRYSKGDEFTVTETPTARSETTITLHKVVAGNYGSQQITETEFGSRASPVVPIRATTIEPPGRPLQAHDGAQEGKAELPEEVRQMTTFITTADIKTKGLLGYFIGCVTSSYPAIRKGLSSECVSALIGIIEDRETSTTFNDGMARSGAIHVLGLFEDKTAARTALPVLERLTKHSDASVVKEAQRAIDGINQPK